MAVAQVTRVDKDLQFPARLQSQLARAAMLEPGVQLVPVLAQIADLENTQEAEKSLEDLVEDMKIAKVWTVVEFMYMYTTGPSGIPEEHIKAICARLPDWLESLV